MISLDAYTLRLALFLHLCSLYFMSEASFLGHFSRLIKLLHRKVPSTVLKLFDWIPLHFTELKLLWIMLFMAMAAKLNRTNQMVTMRPNRSAWRDIGQSSQWNGTERLSNNGKRVNDTNKDDEWDRARMRQVNGVMWIGWLKQTEENIKIKNRQMSKRNETKRQNQIKSNQNKQTKKDFSYQHYDRYEWLEI